MIFGGILSEPVAFFGFKSHPVESPVNTDHSDTDSTIPYELSSDEDYEPVIIPQRPNRQRTQPQYLQE